MLKTSLEMTLSQSKDPVFKNREEVKSGTGHYSIGISYSISLGRYRVEEQGLG